MRQPSRQYRIRSWSLAALRDVVASVGATVPRLLAQAIDPATMREIALSGLPKHETYKPHPPHVRGRLPYVEPITLVRFTGVSAENWREFDRYASRIGVCRTQLARALVERLLGQLIASASSQDAAA